MRSKTRRSQSRSPVPAQNAAFLAFVARIKRRVDTRLQRRLQSELKSISKLGPEVLAACSAATDVCSRGGKRLRAALVFAGARCFPKPASEATLVEIGAAVELLHAYFLIHDDWMDGDLVRRGGPSAHAILRKRFGTSAGDAAAVLAGDWGATVANHWMSKLDLPKATLDNVLSAFFEMQRAAIYGQLRDSLSQGEGVERTYELKTASYTVEGPLTLGAVVSGASPLAVNALKKFAIPLGVAFQLRDDLIGLFSVESATGKPFGSDLKSGKFTAVARDALNHARGRERQRLSSVFGNPRATHSSLTDAVRVIEAVGARDRAEQRIARLLKLADSRLKKAPISEEGRALLMSASTALALRIT